MRVSTRGVLYPFSHRAVYVKTADRQLLPAGSRAVAGLHRMQQLVIVEPERRLDSEDLALRRQFPFASVLMATDTFPAMAPALFQGLPRPVLPDEDLQKAKVADEASLASTARWSRIPRILTRLRPWMRRSPI